MAAPAAHRDDARTAIAAAIQAHAEADPHQRTEREDINSRATVWVDELTCDPQAFALSVARGLSTRPRQLDCRYLYDEIGSELFVEITEQPEYYPTRAEAEILADHADTLATELGSMTLCELGSGTSEKTRRHGPRPRYSCTRLSMPRTPTRPSRESRSPGTGSGPTDRRRRWGAPGRSRSGSIGPAATPCLLLPVCAVPDLRDRRGPPSGGEIRR